jgi:hypothetical protein
MTRLARIVLCLLALARPAFAQNATSAPSQVQVTFYSSGKTFMLLPGSHAAFMGKVFDEDRQLALLGRHRFVTFNLAPGIHVLSSNWWPTTGPSGGTHLTINLVIGLHYYISTSFEEVVLGGSKIIMKQVTCEGAQQDNVDTKPLEQKHLRPAGITLALTETSFPKCL